MILIKLTKQNSFVCIKNKYKQQDCMDIIQKKTKIKSSNAKNSKFTKYNIKIESGKHKTLKTRYLGNKVREGLISSKIYNRG